MKLGGGRLDQLRWIVTTVLQTPIRGTVRKGGNEESRLQNASQRRFNDFSFKVRFWAESAS
jgi:hypothetical protein